MEKQMPEGARVEIEYCTGCRWLARASWVAQELLTTFETELSEVALIPGRSSGVFEVRLNGETLFDRAEQERFPEPPELKQMIRDRVAPERDLGHSERGPSTAQSTRDDAARDPAEAPAE